MNEWEYKTRYLGLEKVDDPRSPSHMTTWVLQYLTEKELAELGSEGWELASMIHMTKIAFGGPMPLENVTGIQYVFKRPKH